MTILLTLLQTTSKFLLRPHIIPNEIAIMILLWCMFGIAQNYLYNQKPEPIKKLIGITPIPTILYVEIALCITVSKAYYDFTQKETSVMYSFINGVTVAVVTLLFVYLVKSIMVMQRRKYDYVFYSEQEEKFYVFDYSNMMDFLQSILDGMDIERERNEMLSTMLTFIHIFKVPEKQHVIPVDEIKNTLDMLKASNSMYENEVIEVEDTDDEECVLFKNGIYRDVIAKLLEEALSENNHFVFVRIRNLKKLRKKTN